jgi:hypothetical protein
MPEGQPPPFPRAFNHHFVVGGEACRALDDGHLAPPGELGESVGELPDHAGFPIAQRLELDGGRTETHAVGRQCLRCPNHACDVQQRLGGYATDVEAYTAERGVTFHQGDLPA